MNKQLLVIITPFAMLMVILFAVYVHLEGFIGGLHAISLLVNIVGWVIMFLMKMLVSIPDFTSTIIQNVITTVIIWVVCILFCTTRKEEKTAAKIVAAIVSAIFTFISWSNLING